MLQKHLPLYFSLLAPVAALAQTAPTVQMERLVITASRNELPVSHVPSRVTLIDREEIERTAALTVPDTLKKNATVDLIQYPAGGGLSGVGIRGFRPEFSGTNQRTLVLLDGRPAGATSLGNLSLDNIDRIEVLKGPASALYGSSAMGGVVNFITRQSTGPVQGSVSTKAGSFETFDARAHLGGTLNRLIDADIAVRHVEAGDYEIAGRGEWYRTAYESDSGTFRVGTTWGGGWRLDVKGDFFLGRNLGSPGAYSDGLTAKSSKDLDRYGADARLRGKIGAHALQATVYGSREYQTTYQEPLNAAAYRGSIRDTTFRGAQLQDAWSVSAPLTLTYGFDYQTVKNDAKSYTAAGARTTASPGDTQETYGYFADGAFKLLEERLIFNLGARYDEITGTVRPNAFSPTNRPGSRDFGTTNPRVGVVVKPWGGWRLHATAGRAFVSPSALQIAGYNEEIGGGQVRVTRGNPALNPESAITWDAGIGWERGAFSADATYFQTKVKDKISTVMLTNTATYRETSYLNAATADQSGIEGELRGDLGQLAGGRPRVWRLATSFTHMIERTERLPAGPAVIRNVARFKLVGALSYDQPTWFARVSSRYVRGMHDQDNSRGFIFTGGRGGIFEYPSFVAWDVSGGYRFTPRHEVSLQVENLFDRFYYEKNDYPMPGRAFYARYRFSF